MRRTSGFTIIEILAVVLIVGVLAAVGVPKIFGALETTRYERAAVEIRELEKRVQVYASLNGALPANWDALGQGAIPNDPWGRPYVYTRHTLISLSLIRTIGVLLPINPESEYDIYSVGPDGQSQTNILLTLSADDVIRGDDGAFVGKASEYK